VAQSVRTPVWIDGIQRHLEDLRGDAYEGASGSERDRRYEAAFELLTPVAVDVLQLLNASILRGTGEVSVWPPGPDGHGGAVGSWVMSWPELSQATNRMNGSVLQPVTISAVFPPGFTHPHLVAGGPVNPRAASILAWPMQVTSKQDAEHHRPVLWAIATTELHDRIYQSSWRIVPG
jgi:hypothetical protein